MAALDHTGIGLQTGFTIVDPKLVHFMSYIDCMDEIQTARMQPSLQSLTMMQLSTLDLRNNLHILNQDTWLVLAPTATTNDTASSICSDTSHISFVYTDTHSYASYSTSNFGADFVADFASDFVEDEGTCSSVIIEPVPRCHSV